MFVESGKVKTELVVGFNNRKFISLDKSTSSRVVKHKLNRFQGGKGQRIIRNSDYRQILHKVLPQMEAKKWDSSC